MGRQIIKQTNGKYAIWSTIVDNFIYCNLTQEECINIRIKEATGGKIETDLKELFQVINRGGNPYLQFGKTFEEALRTIEEIHGKEEIKKIKRMVKG